jgi:hypothetical protein
MSMQFLHRDLHHTSFTKPLYHSGNYMYHLGRAKAQVVSRRRLTAEAPGLRSGQSM